MSKENIDTFNLLEDDACTDFVHRRFLEPLVIKMTTNGSENSWFALKGLQNHS